MIDFHLEILDQKRQKLLPAFLSVKNQFYLAGGTALGLQIGHRDSIDFDFFSEESFDTRALDRHLQDIFHEYTIKKIQEEKDTLTLLLDSEIKISFFAYPYILLEKCIETEYINLASIFDIGCMKLSALISRSTLKDYVDLYYILQQRPLSSLLLGCNKKFPQLDTNLILKSLVYFDDMDSTPLQFMSGKEVSLETVKLYLQEEVKSYVENVR